MNQRQLIAAWFSKTAGMNVPKEFQSALDRSGLNGFDFDFRQQQPILRKISQNLKRMGIVVHKDSHFSWDDRNYEWSLELLLEPKDALNSRWDIAGSREPEWRGPKTDTLVNEVAQKISRELGMSRPRAMLLPWNNFITVSYYGIV